MKKVLVVEDDADVKEMVAFVLASEGCVVEGLENGDGLEGMIESFVPDVLIVDINLPGENGDVLIERLKEKDQLNGTKVFMFSSDARLPEISRRVGADGYIKKPFDVSDLNKVLES